ncbi:MAG: NAD(P)/FAD-dependent oxidoreductase [Planctomycetota bacterium]
MSRERCDVAIVGAGAAGLFAGAFAGSANEGKVVLLEGAKRPGTKILIAGGGRCNVTHDVVRPGDYAGGSRNVVKKVLRSFTVEQTVAWFAQRGVELKREDTGKLFPVTDKARTVLHALLGAVEQAGAELRTGQRVTGVTKHEDGLGFVVSIEGQPDLHADRVVLATGGQALPSSGSDGFGYDLAKHLGHSVTPTWPSLAPLLLEDGHWATALSGLALDVELTLRGPTGKALHCQSGPMLFTHFGLSGPAPMNLSRHATPELPRGATVTANLMPGESFDSVEARLLRAAEHEPKRPVVKLLATALPDRLADALLTRELGIDADKVFADLTRDDRRALAHAIMALKLPVTGDRGFKFAECTAGGVPVTEVEPATMRSRVCDGLYLCGELLDVDGLIGGYNFQWAWCTGRLAGLAASADAAAGIVPPCGARTSPTP